jgi:hypothetical protein
MRDAREPSGALEDATGEPNAEAAQDEAALRRLGPVIECLLFVSPQPVTSQQVAAVLELEEESARTALELLRRHYPESGGLHVVRVAGGYQLRTRPEHAGSVAAFLRPAAQKLSRQALETLAIIHAAGDRRPPRRHQRRSAENAAGPRTDPRSGPKRRPWASFPIPDDGALSPALRTSGFIRTTQSGRVL